MPCWAHRGHDSAFELLSQIGDRSFREDKRLWTAPFDEIDDSSYRPPLTFTTHEIDAVFIPAVVVPIARNQLIVLVYPIGVVTKRLALRPVLLNFEDHPLTSYDAQR